ncbi:MAG: hypothetical protein JWQ36_905 [Enterovirga sp.]|jgi:hypothetical protein|nr:hypothetical protein [Enterovirga sp.]
MSTNKHLKTESPSDADLKGNPGIGQSKGTTMAGEDVSTIAGESTVEGDVENETTPQGGVDPAHTGRTNR